MTDAVDSDVDLARWLTTRLGSRHPVAAVATVSAGTVRVAVHGCEPEADFEIGSLSKGITGLLYVDALRRGEAQPDTTLGDLLPLDGSAVAGVTLAALSTHSSGVPRLPPSSQVLRRSFALWRRGTNPYGESVDELLEQARGVRLGRPRPKYSNLGFELLGHAVAAAAQLSYPDLVEQRLSKPLQLTGMYTPAHPGELSQVALVGRSRNGRPREPWTGAAIAPAGGIRASIGDMARLAATLVDSTAPGLGALDPVAPMAGRARIGAAWITVDLKGGPITFHNGETGGFHSWLSLDRRAGTAAVVLSATAASVDRAGLALLNGL